MLWHVLISLAEDSHFSCAFTLAVGLYFLEGALAEHAEDCSVLREQRREEEKPATRESLVCPYVAVFFQKGSKFS